MGKETYLKFAMLFDMIYIIVNVLTVISIRITLVSDSYLMLCIGAAVYFVYISISQISGTIIVKTLKNYEYKVPVLYSRVASKITAYITVIVVVVGVIGVISNNEKLQTEIVYFSPVIFLNFAVRFPAKSAYTFFSLIPNKNVSYDLVDFKKYYELMMEDEYNNWNKQRRSWDDRDI